MDARMDPCMDARARQLSTDVAGSDATRNRFEHLVISGHGSAQCGSAAPALAQLRLALRCKQRLLQL